MRGGETNREELRHSNPLCAALHQVLRSMVSWCHEDQHLNSRLQVERLLVSRWTTEHLAVDMPACTVCLRLTCYLQCYVRPICGIGASGHR
jgi:hypothetical protein